MQPKLTIRNPITGFTLITVFFFCFFFLMTLNNVSAQVSDNTYGPDGHKQTRIDTARYSDGSPNRIHKSVTYWDPSGYIREEIEVRTIEGSDLYLDSSRLTHEKLKNGDEISKSTSFIKDVLGYVVAKSEITSYRKAGEKEWSVRSGLQNELGKIQVYNTKTKKWEDKKDDSSFDPPPNRLFAGFNLIHEDAGYTHFNTYGGEATFILGTSHPESFAFDLSFNKGSNQGFDYTKTQILAGLNFNVELNKPLVLDFSVLAGYGNLNTQYKPISYSFSNGFLVAKVGGDLGFMFTPKIGVDVGVAYNPSFSNSKVQSNIAAHAGVVLRMSKFKHHHEQERVPLE